MKTSTNSRLISLTQVIAASPSEYKGFIKIAVSDECLGLKVEVDPEIKLMADKLEQFISDVAGDGDANFEVLILAASVAEKSANPDEKQIGLILRLSLRDHLFRLEKENRVTLKQQYQLEQLTK